MEVELLTDAEAILERAGPVLLADEARHNLALGILSFTLEHPDVYPEVRGWAVRERGTVVGAALRTPPYNLVLVRPQGPDALEALVAAIEDELPGVVGGVPEVDAFAESWSARCGVTAATRLDQRIYSLVEVVPPRRVDGAARLAGVADRPLVLGWITAFTEEALHGGDDPGRIERSVDARLGGEGSGGICLWEVGGEPVSLAGFGGPTPNGLRIGPVYTPPERRGCGYGSAVTAAVSQRALDRGKRFCFLYTDLANPTSNAVYIRIGYEPVCDSREIAFAPVLG
ncbi:MAG: GNAT family N-acetyltransferase [Gaiella sp.]|nr:GNAT family N-acetyltransferase [Gaiella sp.]